MRKICFYSTLLLLVPITGIAQPVNDQYLSQSFREAFNPDGIRNLLASPQFQFLLIGTIGIVVAIWLFYLWGSLKMAYEDLEINIFRRVTGSLRPPRVTPPDFDLPHLHDLNSSRMGFAPSLIAVEHPKEKEEKKESATRGDAARTRG